MSRFFKLVLAILPILLVCLLWWTGQKGDVQAGLRLAEEIAGWKLTDSHWFPEHLMHEKINGKAQVYQQFGVIGLMVGTWIKDDQSWDMYLYQMKDARAAEGIYLLERPDKFEPVTGDTKAYRAGASHTSKFGSYYLQLLSLASDGKSEQVDTLAEGVTTALVSGKGDATLTEAGLPSAMQVTGSDGLIEQDAFGYKSMTEVSHALYEVDGRQAMWFIAAGDADTLAAYSAELSRFGGEDLFELAGAVGGNMFDSWEIAAMVNERLVGVRDAESKDALLKHWMAFRKALSE